KTWRGYLLFHAIKVQKIFNMSKLNEEFCRGLIYMKELSMEDSLREIADSLNIEHFDYIVSFNKILWCEYPSEFTESDGISADEDTRILLDIKQLELKGDTLYIYKVCAKKGLYRQAF
ncbi:hypothetical protein, partial [Prevotella koreensis]